jgi:hypothetical protein
MIQAFGMLLSIFVIIFCAVVLIRLFLEAFKGGDE